MPALRYYNKDTGEFWLFGSVDGVNATGMGNATAVPPENAVIVAANFEVQYGDKAIPLSGAVFTVGGTPTVPGSAPRPGLAQDIVATISPAGDIVVTCSPPANAATIPPWFYVFQLAGAGSQPPVTASGTFCTFTAPGPGVWTPTVWVVSADAVSLPATGASVTIGTPTTSTRTVSNVSGAVVIPLLADHTYMLTPISVTGSPVVRLVDQAGTDFSDFDGSTAIPVTIPTGTTQVTFVYWSDLAGSIDFEVTEAGVEAPATVTNDAVVSGLIEVGQVLTVQKAVYSDGTTGDYGVWSVQDLPTPGFETSVGTGTTLLLLPEWEGHAIQWTQFWRIADKSGPHNITQGPIAPANAGAPGALGLSGQGPLGLLGQGPLGLL